MSIELNSADLPLTLLIGGVRAGKSAKALQLAQSIDSEHNSPNILFVATAQAFDDEMQRRITVHQSERPSAWQTLEEPIDLVHAIAHRLEAQPATTVVVIDCITLWVSNLLLKHEANGDTERLVADATRKLIVMMASHSATQAPTGSRQWIIVTNEVGLGVVPPTPLGRHYRDALGRANQLLAAAARDVRVMVAGLELQLKTP